MIEVNVDVAYSPLEDNYNAVMGQILKESAIKCEEIVRREAPVDTGKLRQEIHHFTKGNFQSGVQTKNQYWVHVEYGTAPHTIKPANGKLLKFKGKNGEYVYAKKVNHPGTRANPFVQRSVNKMCSGIIESIAKKYIGKE